MNLTDAQLRAALDRARAHFRRGLRSFANGQLYRVICPHCAALVTASHYGPRERAADSLLVAYATHLLIDCQGDPDEYPFSYELRTRRERCAAR